MPAQYDHESLAWAAGLFDGEGTICAMRHDRKRASPGRISVSPSMQIVIAVSQAGEHAPALLERFRVAVGLGRVYQIHGRRRKPHHKVGYSWRCASFEHVQAVVALLWKWLGEQKRQQSEKALREFRDWPRQRMTAARGRAMARRRWAHAGGL